MYCIFCGKQNEESSQFCIYCGAKIHSAETDGASSQAATTNRKTSRKRLKPVYLAIPIIAVLAIVVVVLLLGSGSSRADFDIPYTVEGVTQFLNTVCKNVDAEYAKIIDPDYDSPAGNSCIASELEIKLPGYVAIPVQVRFHNSHGSDTVTWLEAIFYDDDKDVKFDCKKELVFAIEKTLTGAVRAKEYLTTFSATQNKAYRREAGTDTLLNEYWLEEDLKTEISIRNRGIGWYLFYKIISETP